MSRAVVILCLFCISTLVGFDRYAAWESNERLHKKELLDSHTFLLSYPRSGNTWVRFCLEKLTQRPTLTYHPNPKKMKTYSVPITLEIDLTKKCIWKAHNRIAMEKTFPLHPSKDSLILIVRNYKECTIRHLGDSFSAIEEIDNVHSDYFNNLYIYDTWDSENKLFIYYEDLVLNPKKILSDLLSFLNEPSHLLDDFMEAYDSYVSESLNFYKNHIGKTHFDGKEITYHSKKLPYDIKKTMEDRVKKRHHYLWQKYLTRYDE